MPTLPTFVHFGKILIGIEMEGKHIKVVIQIFRALGERVIPLGEFASMWQNIHPWFCSGHTSLKVGVIWPTKSTMSTEISVRLFNVPRVASLATNCIFTESRFVDLFLNFDDCLHINSVFQWVQWTHGIMVTATRLCLNHKDFSWSVSLKKTINTFNIILRNEVKIYLANIRLPSSLVTKHNRKLEN